MYVPALTQLDSIMYMEYQKYMAYKKVDNYV